VPRRLERLPGNAIVLYKGAVTGPLLFYAELADEGRGPIKGGPACESGVSTRRLRQPQSHIILRWLPLAEFRLTVIFGQYSPSFLAMNTLAVLVVPINGKRLKFFRRHIAPLRPFVASSAPSTPPMRPRFAAEAITCAGVCQYIHRTEGTPMMGVSSALCDHLGLKGWGSTAWSSAAACRRICHGICLEQLTKVERP